MDGITIRLVEGQGDRLGYGSLGTGARFNILRRGEGSRFPDRGDGPAIVATRGSVAGQRAAIRRAVLAARLDALGARLATLVEAN